ncbi:hypothetical protein [Chryseobacterium herbae]|uniref:Uncharacterized protein n=1 Tax=Chryseobacterium herbae TaxID=2976476 RepID=A0ABT2IQY3_9FLAO|nr:hypothetical protein [Chryseobacterium sp. pc1-10]MCT2561229.1 hypothetical protein [Chryseobacterium sp. pc1-10]
MDSNKGNVSINFTQIGQIIQIFIFYLLYLYDQREELIESTIFAPDPSYS